MIYVAEIVVHDGSDLVTHLFATDAFVSRPTDTPANTIARGRLTQPANYTRNLNASAPVGVIETGFGECVVENSDGKLDDLLRVGVDGQSFKLYAKAEHGGDYPDDWTLCLVASMDRVEARSKDKIAFILRDPVKSLLEKPVCATFAGTGGLEGTSAMAGQPKPRVYGAPFNAPLTLLNGTDIYMMSDKPYTACFANFDGRSLISNGASGYDNVANFAALNSQSVAAGTAYRCGAESIVKLGSVPSFKATFDGSRNVSGYPYPYRKTLGDVVTDLMTDAGLAGSLGAGVSGLGYNTSYFVQDTATTYKDILDETTRGCGCWAGFDRLGVLQVATLDAAFGAPVMVLTQHNATLDSFTQQLPRAAVTANGPRNWTTMGETEVANAVKAASLDFATALGKETMSTSKSGSAPAKHPLAEDFEFVDLGSNDNSSGNVIPSGILYAANQRSYLVLQDEAVVMTITTPLTLSALTTVDMGSIVNVRMPRFGLDAGDHLYRVIGIRYEFAMRKITYTLWG